MIPFTSDAEIAQSIVSSTKFPPMGNRGVDGAGLDGDFGLEVWNPGSTYFEDANQETFIVAQIETPEALANIEEVAAVPGIDLIFIGPADLGLRLSHAPDALKATMDEAVERVAAAAKKHGKAWGRTAGSIEELVRYREMGAQMVPWGSDFMIFKVLENCGKELDGVL